MSLSVFAAICLAIFLVVLGVVAIYLVQTLVQIRRTALSAQILLENLNKQSLRLDNVTGALSNVAGLLGGTAGRTVAAVLSGLQSLMRRRSGPPPSA